MRKVLLFSVPVLALVLFISLLPRPDSRTVSAAPAGKDFLASLRPQTAQAVKFAVTEPLSAIAARSPAKKFDPKQVRPEQEKRIPNWEVPGAVHDTDGVLARFLDTPMPAPGLSFEGMNDIDNGIAHGILVLPPDTNGDVGPKNYVQSMNILFRVFDKSGNAQTPPIKMSSLFAPLGTGCSTRDDGEPSILYDPLADRWLMSQYCTLTPPFRQMVAVSQTGDPMGSYYVYEFVMPFFKQNDVSKFGVWPNAYYMSDEQFLGSDYAGTGAFAFDRAKLLSGDPTASYVYFDIPSTVGTTRVGNILPADMDGLTPPPANVSGLFMGYTATEYGDAQDALRIFELRPNFDQPLNSTFSELAGSPIAVTPYDPTSPAGRPDIPQPPPGEMLDSNSDRLMYRLAYRNFGSSESLVVNETVRITPLDQNYSAGVRVFELSRTSPSSPFTVKTQSTIGAAGENRWIGSAAQDRQGDIAVGYNLGGLGKKPSIYYSGRAATDPPDTFRSEAALVDATGVQTAFGFRWGDYTNMTVDPVDDCTFWYNGQYFTQESQDQSPFGWKTRIGNFKFPECTAAARGQIQGVVTNSVTGQPVSGALVSLNTAFSRSTDPQGTYAAMLPPDTYPITVSAHGYISQTVQVSLANGATVVQNFVLQPRAVPESGPTDLTSESCAINGAIEPGETVTIALPLRNTGAVDMGNVTVTLQPGGGVTNPSGPQNYGALPVGGNYVTRSFTFTASPNLSCGSHITLSFQITDGASSASSLGLLKTTGTPNFILNEPFAGSAPEFPAGWTTAITGEQEPWQKVLLENTTDDYAAFSPEPVHPGINELVSPVVHLNGSNVVLSFSNKFDLESTFLRNLLYDGGVLEIKIGSGDFQDIVTAGGVFTAGGYNGPIAACCSNPLAGRMAWSSKSGIDADPVWITSQVNLPPSAAGQDVQFRWRVATDIGGHRTGQWIDNVKVQDGVSCSCQAVGASAPFDFDGDHRTDLSVFHPSDDPVGSDFEYFGSQSGTTQRFAWGSVGDLPANGDYDGDGKTDVAVFRPSNNAWYILQSSNGAVVIATFGLPGDKLAPADYDGDSRADIAVFRPSTGVWYVIKSGSGQIVIYQFGVNDDIPVPEDFDGDGKDDIAVWRPSTGVWYVFRSSDSGFTIIAFGKNGDKPATGDFDGDGRADFVVYRPSEGLWYLFRSTLGFTAVQFGLSGDRPLQGDFDGDGKRDIAVYRPETNVWYYLRSSDGVFAVNQFGHAGDMAVPSIYVP
jgi:hypothetical protein